jgi:hypothetical protein
MLLAPITSAYSADFTPIFNPATDTVHYNVTYELDKSATTPFDIWAAAIIVGLVLFLFSLLALPNGAEDIVSVMAWIPLAFASWSSFAVDSIVSSGVTSQSGTYVLMEHHLVQTFPTIGLMLLVFLVVAIGNTYRIVSLHKKLNAQLEEEYLA